MNSRIRIALAFGASWIAVGLGGVWVGARWFAPRPAPAKTAQNKAKDDRLPEMQIDDVNYGLSDHGKPLWKFSAKTVQESDNGKTALKGLKRGVYYKDGKPYLSVKAGYAEYDRVTRMIKMTGGVSASGADGVQFSSPTLQWNESDKSIICQGPVRFQTADGWVLGSMLTGDLKKRSFKLKQVSGEFKLDNISEGAPL